MSLQGTENGMDFTLHQCFCSKPHFMSCVKLWIWMREIFTSVRCVIFVLVFKTLHIGEDVRRYAKKPTSSTGLAIKINRQSTMGIYWIWMGLLD